MNLHLPLIPGEDPDNQTYAFTALAHRFVRMMRGQGHSVTTYPLDVDRPAWDNQPAWDSLSQVQASIIRRNLSTDDVVCLPAGYAQRAIVDAALGVPCVEYAIGYPGTCAPWRVFPSSAWMHTVIGSEQRAHAALGRWGDVVIPHPIDTNKHPLGTGKGEYLLYVGRLIERKGLDVAIHVAREVGIPLIAAGEGEHRPPGAEYVGHVTPTERAALMGDARALLAPTLYVEPFGMVVIEARACGTPALTTDWGAFKETVPGPFRCLTTEDFVEAVKATANISRREIQRETFLTYGMDVIAPRYDAFLQRVVQTNRTGS